MKRSRSKMGGRRNSLPRVGDPFGIDAHQLVARGNGEKVAVVLPDGKSASGQISPEEQRPYVRFPPIADTNVEVRVGSCLSDLQD